MLAIGLMAYKKTSNTEDYFLGGRKLGSWVVSLSAQASDMSGWMLMGLPGAAYIAGLEAGWIALGLTIGTYLNWKLVAKRLRNYTEACNAITIPQFLFNKTNIAFYFIIYINILLSIYCICICFWRKIIFNSIRHRLYSSFINMRCSCCILYFCWWIFRSMLDRFSSRYFNVCGNCNSSMCCSS